MSVHENSFWFFKGAENMYMFTYNIMAHNYVRTSEWRWDIANYFVLGDQNWKLRLLISLCWTSQKLKYHNVYMISLLIWIVVLEVLIIGNIHKKFG